MRIDVFDCIKGIAICLVVFGHALRQVGGYLGALNSFPAIVDKVIYSFHMPLFFIVSGLFHAISLSEKTKRESMKSKTILLLYPYFIWSIIHLSMKFFDRDQIHFYNFFATLYDPFWFLWFIYVLYLYSMIYILASGWISEKTFLFLSVLCIVIAPYFETRVPHLILHNFIFFSTGLYLGNNNFNYFKKSKYNAVHFSCALSVFTATFLVRNFFGQLVLSLFFKNIILTWCDVVLAFCGTFIVFGLSQFLLEKITRIFVLIGRYTMCIYLAHCLFIVICSRIFNDFLNFSDHFFLVVTYTIFGIFGPVILLIVCQYVKFPYIFYFPYNKTTLSAVSSYDVNARRIGY